MLHLSQHLSIADSNTFNSDDKHHAQYCTAIYFTLCYVQRILKFHKYLLSYKYVLYYGFVLKRSNNFTFCFMG